MCSRTHEDVSRVNQIMKSDIFFTEVKEGYCRICGRFDRLTREHVIPKNAGGGVGVKLYNPIDLLKDKDSSRYILKQDGLTARTLCAGCNNLIGREYDEDFGIFYKTVNYAVSYEIKKKINNGEIKKRDGFNRQQCWVYYEKY